MKLGSRPLLRFSLVAAVAIGCDAGVGEPTETDIDPTQTGTETAAPSEVVSARPAPPAPVVSEPEPLPPAAVGHWYLDREGDRRVLVIEASSNRTLRGTTRRELTGAADEAVEAVSFDERTGMLRLRTPDGAGATWYQLRILDGVARGRFAPVTDPQAPFPSDASAFTGRVTGWRAETFDAELTPRVFELSIDGRAAKLRLDRANPADPFVARLNIYTASNETLDEQPAEDVSVESWDGRQLVFVRMAADGHARFTGVVEGRTIAGTFTTGDGGEGSWSGMRAEILTHGLVERSAAQARDWQLRTRERLRLLMMAGTPAPSGVTVLSTSDARDPRPLTELVSVRDDAPKSWPQAYTVTELNLAASVPNAFGEGTLVRKIHAYLSVPTTPAPPGGYPVVMALNGHAGSAAQLTDPDNWLYWYGEAFARRGNVVIAVDISHRPLADRGAIYGDFLTGDDESTGNGPHPAIAAPGMTSDWEEDGERAWDAMRALDHVLRRTDVNPARVTVAGLSMGAEITAAVGAFDERVAATVAAGGPTDYTLMWYHYNHTCWMWQAADTREYVDPGDIHALMAGRTSIHETGRADVCFSSAAEPYASAKQVIRRAQPAFTALGGKLIHFMHDGQHEFRFGDQIEDAPATGLTIPLVFAPAPDQPWSTAWQTDGATTLMAGTLFDEMP